MSDDLDFDLDRQRAVRYEVAKRPQQVRFGGKVLATLPPEMPLSWLEPLASVSPELVLLARKAVDAANAQDTQDAALLALDMLSVRPDLPAELITAVKQIGERILGPDGYIAFVAQAPSPQDVAAFAKGLFRRYGVRLGEASPSTGTSSDGGTTSNGTSDDTSVSTPETPGVTPATRDTSESAG